MKVQPTSEFKRILNADTQKGMTQKSKIYEFAVDLFVHLSEIAFKYSILAK